MSRKRPHSTYIRKIRDSDSIPDSNFVVFLRSLLLGGLAGAFSKSLVAPLERIKIIRQVESNSLSSLSGYRDFSSTGIVDCARQLLDIRELSPRGRILSFWRGNFVNCIRYFPTQALNFAFKGQYRRIFGLRPISSQALASTPSHQASFSRDLVLGGLSGGLAGATSLIFVYPLDFVRTLLISDVGGTKLYPSMRHCCADIVSRDGVSGLYRGFSLSVRGVFVYRAFYFGGYDLAKKYLLTDRARQSFWKKWALSHTVSIGSQLATYPFDTVRRRIQLSEGGLVGRGGAMKLARQISLLEGWRGLYKGAMANAIRATGAAISLVFYDTVGGWLFQEKDFGSV